MLVALGVRAKAGDDFARHGVTGVDGNLEAVEFLDGTNRLAEVTASPFRFRWTNALAGSRRHMGPLPAAGQWVHL